MPTVKISDLALEKFEDDWAYGASNRSVVIKGAYCDKLKKGNIKQAQVKFGCPGQVIL